MFTAAVTALTQPSAVCVLDTFALGYDRSCKHSQGVNEDLQPQLHQSIAYSAARYGHVMHPENASEPVVACAEALLGSVGKGWAHRVFFSADGCANPYN